MLIISFEFPHSIIDIVKNKSIIKEPISVIKYNEHMFGVEHQDHMTSYCQFKRKTLVQKKCMYIVYIYC